MRARWLVVLVAAGFAIAAPARLAAQPAARPPVPGKPVETNSPGQLQKQADRHFKTAVALFNDRSFADALAEFERAYEIAPHPLVLYNIAACHRELGHVLLAVSHLRRFLVEGRGMVQASLLTDAATQLDTQLAKLARVTVTIKPPVDGVQLVVDGEPVDGREPPLLLLPGEHLLVARAPGRLDAARTVTVRAGESTPIELAFAVSESATPPVVAPPGGAVDVVVPGRGAGGSGAARPPRLSLDAGFGTDVRRIGKTGAPSIGLGVDVDSRIGLAIQAVLVAYAVVPSIRVRIAGDALSLHLLGAVPVAFSNDAMTGTFVAAAAGLGVRYRPTPWLAVRADAYLSVASKGQGTALPTFVGGELWF